MVNAVPFMGFSLFFLEKYVLFEKYVRIKIEEPAYLPSERVRDIRKRLKHVCVLDCVG